MTAHLIGAANGLIWFPSLKTETKHLCKRKANGDATFESRPQ